VRDLGALSGFAVVFVNYTPSLEAQYPQAINEIYVSSLQATVEQLKGLPPV